MASETFIIRLCFTIFFFNKIKYNTAYGFERQ